MGCGLACLALPVSGQEADAPIASVTVVTAVRHVSAVVLPVGVRIVEVVAGDAEHWDVSAAAHMAFVRPLLPGTRSNVLLLTDGGAVLPLVVIEASHEDAPDGAVDSVIRIDPPTSTWGPVLTEVEEVEAARRRVSAAWAAVEGAESRSAERVVAARDAAQAELDAEREGYPRQLHFDYRWPEAAAEYPWLLEGMWHDGERTYVRLRATSPVFYEATPGLTRVAGVSVVDDVLYVVPRVLGAGALEVGGRRLPWRVEPRVVGP